MYLKANVFSSGKLTRGCVYQDSTKINDEGWHIDSCYDDRPFACQRPLGEFHSMERVFIGI